MGSQKPVDTMRLRKEALQGLVDAIESRKAAPPGVSRRVHERHPFVDYDVVLTISEGDPGRAGGLLVNPRSFLVCSRNLSCGGIGVLHGSFLHTGTWCEVRIRDVSGQMVTVSGRVVGCRHVSGRVHEIGIAFQQVVEVDRFRGPVIEQVVEAPPGAEEVGRAERVSAAIPDLRGLGVVLVQDDVRRRRLAGALDLTGMEVQEAPFLGAALDAVRLRRVDLVVVAFDLDDSEPAKTLLTLRRAGYAGPVLALPGERRLDPRFDEAVRPGMLLRGRITNMQLMDSLKALAPAA